MACDLAVETVVRKIKLRFPQYDTLGQLFKQHCIEEEYDELDTLIDDFGEGFAESVVLENVAEEIDIKEDDKEAICQEIHYILSNSIEPEPTELNLGIFIISHIRIKIFLC